MLPFQDFLGDTCIRLEDNVLTKIKRTFIFEGNISKVRSLTSFKFCWHLSSKSFCNHFVISTTLCSKLSEELKTFSKVLKTFSLAEDIYELHILFGLLFIFENSSYRLSFQMEFSNTVCW